MEELIFLLIVAGIVELTNRVRARDWWTVVTIVSAAAVGGLLGLAGYYATNPIEGIGYGLAASGLITVAGAVKSIASARAAIK